MNEIIKTMRDAFLTEFWDAWTDSGDKDEQAVMWAYTTAMRAALRAAESVGWVLVPKEPTDSMVTGGWKWNWNEWAGDEESASPERVYRSMLDAAPSVVK